MRKDFKELMDSMYIYDAAENHIEAWQHRYRGLNISQVFYELDVSYDWTCEEEALQDKLGREPTEKELYTFRNAFINEVAEQLGLALSPKNKDRLTLIVKELKRLKSPIYEDAKMLYDSLIY